MDEPATPRSMITMVDMSSTEPDRLENFPITFFAVIMGLLGLTLALAAAERAAGAGFAVHSRRIGHGVPRNRVLLRPEAAPRPARCARSGTIPCALPSSQRSRSRCCCWAPRSHRCFRRRLRYLEPRRGGPGHAALSVVANWIGHRTFQAIHLSPAWFIAGRGQCCRAAGRCRLRCGRTVLAVLLGRPDVLGSCC
jgi:tellurite resistance protein